MYAERAKQLLENAHEEHAAASSLADYTVRRGELAELGASTK